MHAATGASRFTCVVRSFVKMLSKQRTIVYRRSPFADNTAVPYQIKIRLQIVSFFILNAFYEGQLQMPLGP